MKSRSDADGDLDGHGGAAEGVLHALQGALEVGALAVQLIDDDGARQLEIVGETPDLLGLHLDAGHAVDHHQRGIGGDQGRARIVNKDVVAGSIEEVDLGLFPLRHGDGGRDRDFALDFLLVEIGDRIALIHAEQAVGGAGGEEQTGGERRLAGIAVAHHTDVPDVLAFVDFHGCTPSRSGLAGRPARKNGIVTQREQ